MHIVKIMDSSAFRTLTSFFAWGGGGGGGGGGPANVDSYIHTNIYSSQQSFQHYTR